jgi:hypothetical protein
MCTTRFYDGSLSQFTDRPRFRVGVRRVGGWAHGNARRAALDPSSALVAAGTVSCRLAVCSRASAWLGDSCLRLCGARFHALQLSTSFVTLAERHTSRTKALQPPTGNACALAIILTARFFLAAWDYSLHLNRLGVRSQAYGTRICPQSLHGWVLTRHARRRTKGKPRVKAGYAYNPKPRRRTARRPY